MKRTIEFTEQTMGYINEHLDTIQNACYNAMLNGKERDAVQNIQSELIALKQLITEQAIFIMKSA